MHASRLADACSESGVNRPNGSSASAGSPCSRASARPRPRSPTSRSAPFSSSRRRPRHRLQRDEVVGRQEPHHSGHAEPDRRRPSGDPPVARVHVRRRLLLGVHLGVGGDASGSVFAAQRDRLLRRVGDNAADAGIDAEPGAEDRAVPDQLVQARQLPVAREHPRHGVEIGVEHSCSGRGGQARGALRRDHPGGHEVRPVAGGHPVQYTQAPAHAVLRPDPLELRSMRNAERPGKPVGDDRDVEQRVATGEVGVGREQVRPHDQISPLGKPSVLHPSPVGTRSGAVPAPHHDTSWPS